MQLAYASQNEVRRPTPRTLGLEVSDAVEETAGNVFAALGMAAEELKIGFSRVRKAISEDK